MKALDFDLFLTEMRKEPIPVTVRGKTYDCKSEIPAIVPLTMARVENMKEAAEKENRMATLIFGCLDALFGEEAATEIACSLSAREAYLLVSKLIQRINAGEDEEDEEVSDDTRLTSARGSAKK